MRQKILASDIFLGYIISQNLKKTDQM